MARVDPVRTLRQTAGTTAGFQTGQAVDCGQDGCPWREACECSLAAPAEVRL